MNYPLFRVFCTFAILLFLFFSKQSSAQSAPSVGAFSDTDLAERKVITDAVDAAVSRRDFSTLTAMAERFRSERGRTASGVWKLSVFYTGFWRLGGKDADGTCINPGPEFAKDWMRTAPDEPAAYILEGSSYLAYGYCLRGRGFVGETSTTALSAWNAHSIKALKFMIKYRYIAYRDPHFYATLVDIYTATGAPRHELEELLDEATAHEPYYYETYFSALKYYLPKWLGRPGDIERLGRYAVSKTKDVDGSGSYTRLYWMLMNEPDSNPKWMDWSTVKLGMHDILQAYPDDWNITSFAHMACKAGDASRVAELLYKRGRRQLPRWSNDYEFNACFRRYWEDERFPKPPR